MKMRILTAFCYVAAFAAGAVGVDHWFDRHQAVAQDGWTPLVMAAGNGAAGNGAAGDGAAGNGAAGDGAAGDGARETAPEPSPGLEGAGLRGAVYDAERQDPRLIRISDQPAQSRHVIVAPRTDPVPGALQPRPEPASAPRAAPAPAARQVPLEKMIGQMLVFGFQGTSADQKWPRILAGQLADGTLGGTMFLKYNLAGETQGKRLMKALHASAADADTPPLFMVDQEGGQVQRLAGNVGLKTWPSAARMGRGSLDAARAEYAGMADALEDWGFNVNLGPVVDVNVNPRNPIIGKKGRSFSGDPDKVTAFARAFIEAHRAHGILTALKHFPGHGSSRSDSHLGFTDISQSWQEQTELAPYRALIGSGSVDMVMMGHLYLGRFARPGEARYPATLSKGVVTGLLRERLGFDGVIVSDDMEMGAIRQHYGAFEAAIMAIKAGVDMLIVSNSARPDARLPEKYVAAIAEAARKDPELMGRIAQSYMRIIAMKRQLASASLGQPLRRAS